jgi:hypothetical protein
MHTPLQWLLLAHTLYSLVRVSRRVHSPNPTKGDSGVTELKLTTSAARLSAMFPFRARTTPHTPQPPRTRSHPVLYAAPAFYHRGFGTALRPRLLPPSCPAVPLRPMLRHAITPAGPRQPQEYYRSQPAYSSTKVDVCISRIKTAAQERVLGSGSPIAA